MKKNKLLGAGLVSLVLFGSTPTVVEASSLWYANTPNEIGKLNSDGTYTVKKGDTIWAIGIHFNIKPSVIEEVNHINDPYHLQIGTILKLHIDKTNDKATIEAVSPEGIKYEKTLTVKDKIIAHKKFGENVTQEITPKKEQQAYDKANENKQSGKVKQDQGISNEQLAMASYYAWYGKDGNTVSDKQSLYFVQDGATSYVVGQGTADNTAKITINGNTITYDGGGNGTTPNQEGTLNKQDVINKYYSTDEQKKIINNAIKHSSTYGEKARK